MCTDRGIRGNKVKIHSVKFNALMNFILKISLYIFPIITFPYVTRVLQVDGIGQISFATSVVSYFVMLSSLGIPNYGIKACAIVRDDKKKLTKTVQELLAISLIVTVIAYVVFFVLLFAVPKFRAMKTLLIIDSMLLIFNALGVEWFYQAIEQYSYITIRNLIFKSASLILVFLLVRDQSDIYTYSLITVIATSGSNVLNFLNLRKYIYLKPQCNLDLAKHIKPTLIFFATSVAISVYTQLDTVMLGLMTNNHEVGLYSVAMKIQTVLTVLVASVDNVLLPRMAHYVATGEKNDFNDLVVKMTYYNVFLGGLITVFFFIYTSPVISLISGNGYLEAGPAVKWLLLTIIPVGLSSMTGAQIMASIGKEKQHMYSVLAGGITDFLLNLIVIPKFGAAGAAFSTAVTEVVVLAMDVMFIKNLLAVIKGKVKWWKTGVSLVMSVVVGLLIYRLQFHYILKLMVGFILMAIVYVGLLIILRDDFIMDEANKVRARFRHG